MRLIGNLHQRLLRFTNGEGRCVRPFSARAHLTAAGALLVLTLTLMEPASATGMSAAVRLLFYAAHVFPAMAAAWWLSGWLFNRTALRAASPWLLLAAAGAGAGLLLAPLSVSLEMALGVVDLDHPAALPLAPTAAAWWGELQDELWQVPLKTALFWPAMNAWVIWRAEQRLGEPALLLPIPSTTDASSAAAGVSLMDRLPARLGRDLVLLEAQEHYLRVVTARGEHLMLHGLGQAIDDVQRQGAAGMQIHRSLWVAWRHVERLDLRPSSPAVLLDSGERLPIGRRRVKEVAEAWHRWPGA